MLYAHFCNIYICDQDSEYNHQEPGFKCQELAKVFAGYFISRVLPACSYRLKVYLNVCKCWIFDTASKSSSKLVCHTLLPGIFPLFPFISPADSCRQQCSLDMAPMHAKHIMSTCSTPRVTLSVRSLAPRLLVSHIIFHQPGQICFLQSNEWGLSPSKLMYWIVQLF